MLERHAEQILAKLAPTDLVLDVGGWARPFNRAQWVLDAEPYQTRGFYAQHDGPPAQGGEREWFTAETWVQRDICDREPWPFHDQQFDFAICSHTLEDIRDPLWVCSELKRVAKRGYLEFPSREWECCRGLERHNQAGLSHHRWFIEVQGNHLVFLQKFHSLHSHWRFSLPSTHIAQASRDAGASWLWWEADFSWSEITIHGVQQQEAELERFVRTIKPYPTWWLELDRIYRAWLSLQMRVVGKVKRTLQTSH